ncbi:MAG: hypothetical protein JWN22_1943 [Nocardioides sp.]|jgi:hypothetical protein|nr:hypothetical protein [Nocardioides sp.]
MSKRLTHVLTYDAPLAAVAAMLADPAFREQVCDAQGVLRHTVTIEGDAADGDLEVTVDQVQAASGIPSFAKKFVGDEINVVQTESWSSPGAGDIRVTIPGKPGDMSGTARLTESGGTTTETVTLDIKVGIPLVGGKIEGLVADLLLKALKAENRVGRDYLSR